MEQYTVILSLLLAYFLDKALGDPYWLPHPIVAFGKLISLTEKRMNCGKYRLLKGSISVAALVLFVFLLFDSLGKLLAMGHVSFQVAFNAIFIYYGIAGKTLIRESEMVFDKLKIGIDQGRKQVARIVGRDTRKLSAQEIRAATLETMAENLSDGVIAPLFWFAIAGVPGIMTYKMINTLDSMIGYKNQRFIHFGRCAAYLDDVVNYIPARITALLMASVNGSLRAFRFIVKYGKAHSSPNAGFPEAALAGILNAQFGGMHYYFGEKVEKPVIGDNIRHFSYRDFIVAKRTNLLSEIVMLIILVALAYYKLIVIILFI